MRLGLVAEHFDPRLGGLERWTVDLARYLAASGHEVHVAAFGGDPGDAPVRVHLARPARTERGRAAALDAVLARLALDVVHDTGLCRSGDVLQPQTGSRLSALDREIATHSRLRRAKAAISPRMQLRRLEMSRLEKAQVARALAIIAVSHRVAALLEARFGYPPERLRVIRNGVDSARFASSDGNRRLAGRTALGIGRDEVLLVSVAHNLRLKGVETSVRALERLIRAGHPFRLVVAGGQPDAALLKLVRRAALGPYVRFLGYVEDVPCLLAAADAFVHPTRWDACSVSTLEAVASGLPVVTTRFDGAADVVAEAECGWIMEDPDDHDALEDALIDLLHMDRRARMSQNARAAAASLRQDFTAIEAVLLDVAEMKRSGAGPQRHASAT